MLIMIQKISGRWPAWLCITPFLRKLYLAPVIVLAISAVQIWAWASDREPPLRLISQVEPIPSAVAGSSVILRAMVKRQTQRGCDLTYTRFLLDVNGTRYDISGIQVMDDSVISLIEKEHPGELNISFIVPAGVPPGLARLITTSNYVCNPLHNWWPITVFFVLGIDVV